MFDKSKKISLSDKRKKYTEGFCAPQWLFKKIDKEFHFDLDVCATTENTKCDRYYTEEEDGLSRVWFGNAWCCPDCGKNPSAWVKKALGSNCNTVMLLNVNTHAEWFHKYLYYNPNIEIRFLEGSIKTRSSATTGRPMMLVIIRNEKV